MDLYTRCCLTAIAVLLTVLVIGLWATGPAAKVSEVAAAEDAEVSGIGNPSAQRMAMIRAIGATNQKLEKIIGLLQSGKIKVILAKTEAENVPGKAQKPRK